MPHAFRLEADAVRAAITGRDVVNHFALTGRRAGAEWRTRTCPACGPRSRDAVTINLATGRWFDHAHGCRGDSLALVAALADLDVRRDFPRVLELAKVIAGLEAEPHRRPERARIVAARQAAQDAHRTAERRSAAIRAGALWARLASDHARGRGYLDGRGLDALRLIACGAVRFWGDGSPGVPLHDDTGAVANVMRRRIVSDASPKVLGLRGCPTTGTLVGSATDITRDALVIVCEGTTDALAARLIWPSAVVLGAHSAARLPEVARLAAERIAAAGAGRLTLALDDDAAGLAAGRAALDAIAATGLESAAVDVLDLGDAHDLADAYAAGWRP